MKSVDGIVIEDDPTVKPTAPPSSETSGSPSPQGVWNIGSVSYLSGLIFKMMLLLDKNILI